MDTLHLKTLALVAKYKNFTKVSELIGKIPGGIRHQMDVLESHLKVKLYHGVPSGIQLTEEGVAFAAEAEEICARLERRMADIKNLKNNNDGQLKLIASNFGMQWFTSHLREFNHAHPSIELKIILDESKNLFFESLISGVFVGLLATNPPKKTSFIWTKLGQFHWYPYAHPNYIKTYGRPKNLEDLDNHQLIGYEWSPEHSYLETQESNVLLYHQRDPSQPRKPIVTTDDVMCCKRLIEQGIGIGLLPRFAAKETDLIELFEGEYPKESGLIQELYFIYPPHLKQNKRVMEFKNFIMEKIITQSPFQ